MFSSNSLMISGCWSRPLIHLDLIFVLDERYESYFLVLQAAFQWQNSICWRDKLLCLYYFQFSCWRLVSYICGITPGISILSYWSYLFLYQYQTILMIISLYYVLRTWIVIPSAWFLFFSIAVAIHGLSWLQMNFSITFSAPEKNVIGTLIGITLNMCVIW